MKKVKDYFKLPVTGQQIVDEYSGDINWFKATEQDEAIANAINHVDALVDALDCMLSSGSFEDRQRAEEMTKAILASYRGEL